MKSQFKLLSLIFFISFSLSSINASNDKVLLLKAHHSRDNLTFLNIWRTSNNTYIVRFTYEKEPDEFRQTILHQSQIEIKWDGFAKTIIFNERKDSNWTVTHRNKIYSVKFNAYFSSIGDYITVDYTPIYINEKLFDQI
ncbi:MAG: hypothetical protein PHI32_05675 [Dysgonamonadaceae bacterium]|nr:hypothetical protein [Dysgonamonadaceae bacterium]MDD4728479.1 hypothetical protein [Dysgonamonadaceae bacterium]